MTNLILISGGGIAGIIIGIIAVALIAFFTAYKLLPKKKAPQNYKFVEFSGDNTQLLELVDVGDKYSGDATVIVPPTHYAIIIRNGEIVNVCSGGEFPLYEDGGNDKSSAKKSVRSLKVIYISKTVKVTIRWGTKLHQRIEYLDPKIGKPVSVGAFGVMDVRVSDPKKFYLELVANFGNIFSVEDLQERIRTCAVDQTFRAIGNVLNEKKLSYIEFTSAKYDIQTQVGKYLSDKFTEDFGFEVRDFIIENMNITKEQEEEIKNIYSQDSSYEREKVLFDRKQETEERERQALRRRKEAVRDDAELDDFLYNREFAKERDIVEYERKLVHEDEDRAWAREDKRRELEERMESKYLDTVKDIEISRSEAEKSKAVNEAAATSAGNAGHHCSVCGSGYKPGAKYCPGCGAVLPREDVTAKCPGCGKEVPWGTAFCPYCGRKCGR